MFSSPRSIRQHWRKILSACALAVGSAAAGLAFWAGSQIASPTRRPLMDYHRDFLSNPTTHGLQIQRFIVSDGTPSLVCTPCPSGNLGTRGVKVRQQLEARGTALPAPGKITATLVLLHGRKGRKEDYLPVAERLCAAGFRCVIPDLPAHGEHPAAVATYGVREASLPARVLEEAAKFFAFEKQPAGLIGMSMGGSVAVHAAALPGAPWQALVVISSFDSFPPVIAHQASRYVGTTAGPLWATATNVVFHWKSGIALDDIQPHEKAALIRIPTFVAHGSGDHVVPIASGRRLFDSLTHAQPKKWEDIPGADHDNVLITPFPIYADIAAWMILHLENPPQRHAIR